MAVVYPVPNAANRLRQILIRFKMQPDKSTNPKLIALCIEGALNQLHLDTCRSMIDTRITNPDEKNDLYNQMQVREVEIIVQPKNKLLAGD